MTKERAKTITGDQALLNNTVKGEFNRTIYTTVKCLLNQSHRIEYPLFLYGETGVGKTHMINVIRNGLTQKDYETDEILYFRAED